MSWYVKAITSSCISYRFYLRTPRISDGIKIHNIAISYILGSWYVVVNRRRGDTYRMMYVFPCFKLICIMNVVAKASQEG